MRILILGPQGSGKGTQAKRIAAEYDAPHVATGDILRAAVANGSELGHQVRPILERGDLVPDDLMVGLIRERLADEDAFVLDGFPRTVAQAEALDAMLDEIGKPLDAVILLRVSDEVATERLEARARAEGRADDSPEAIRNRLRLYHELTEQVVDRYQLAGIEVIVDGEQTMDEVFADIQDALRAWPRVDDHPQELSRDREDGRGGRARRRDDRARRRAPAPGRHDRGARRRCRRVHPRARRHPDVGGLQGLPEGDLHLRRTTSSSTASRTTSRSATATWSRSTSA